MNIIMLGRNTKEEIETRLKIVSAAGLLSRSEGTVTDVYESRKDYEQNLRIVSNIVGYGHKSITEHDYIVLALENVTPIIEQTLIEYRLASFTIKSRRNVDFRNVGFYIPEFKNQKNEILRNNAELKEKYITHMKSLFNKYGELVDEGLPIEDCRYILPYSYHSNIIMGCDANELLKVTSDLLYSKISKIDEIYELGKKLEKIIQENIPYLSKNLEREKNKTYYEDQFSFLDEMIVQEKNILEKVNMTNYTPNADEIVLCNILMSRYQLSYEKSLEILKCLTMEDENIKENMMNSLIKSKNQRELEQVFYSFEFPISLAVLTHITRHRMHSLLVPDFVPMWNLDNYIFPDSLKKNHKEDYIKIFKENNLMMKQFKEQGVRDEDLVYFYLSGNACNIYTTMNARTLEWISRMRTCNKAQWEIRYILQDMVNQAKEVSPLIGKCFGPTCDIEGYCPEGKDSCKARGVVTKKLIK